MCRGRRRRGWTSSAGSDAAQRQAIVTGFPVVVGGGDDGEPAGCGERDRDTREVLAAVGVVVLDLGAIGKDQLQIGVDVDRLHLQYDAIAGPAVERVGIGVFVFVERVRAL